MSSFSSSLTGSKEPWLVLGPLLLGVALCALAILFVLRPRAPAFTGEAQAAPEDGGQLGGPPPGPTGIAPGEVAAND